LRSRGAGSSGASRSGQGLRAAAGRLQWCVIADFLLVQAAGALMRRRLIPGALFALLLAVPLGLQAQDRIQLGIEYRPGVRPGIMVAAGAGLDSVRKIVERDLQ